jgi:hypothetical protein
MLLAAVKRGSSAEAATPAPEAETDRAGDSDPATTATSANVKNPSE